MILLVYFQALAALEAFAAPANLSQPLMPINSTQMARNTGLSSQLVPYTNASSIASVTSTLSIALTSLSNVINSSPSQLTEAIPNTVPAAPRPSFVSFSLAASSIPLPPLLTSTTFVTEVVTAFETTAVNVTPSSTTIVTEVVTITATLTATPSPSWNDRTLWAAPPQMTDLSAFNVTYFPAGQQNLRIVTQIPSEAIASTAKFVQEPLSSLDPTASSTFLQLVYPARSVNPGSKPTGGADFYASPLNLTGARNVTLAYSVFFPADFDWVKGGKLPGLFGGHTGCSGGASARDCFSTRLMWRPGGVGELYLYAPKDKQSDALCADANSVCDAAYGFSIGRGTFNFSAGDWTRLVQNVVLNTPGRNDGGFMLAVDGRPVIQRTDVFYRDVAKKNGKNRETQPPVEFLGLFFSTFFGGHGKKYATPKEQYTWFKDFAIARHD